MKKTFNKTMTITTLAASMILGACSGEDELGRGQGGGEDRLVVSDTMVDILGWVGGEAASFVAGEIFGLALPDDAADLSDDALDEIERIVNKSVRTGELTTQNGRFNSVVADFNRYSRETCDSGVTESGDCEADELRFKRTVAQGIFDDARESYAIYHAWVTQTGEDIRTDRDWQVFLSKNVRLAMTIDLAMLREYYEIERVLELDSAEESWSTLQDTADEYLGVMEDIEDQYESIKSEFGNPRVHNFGSVNDKEYKGCFDVPGGGEWCTEETGTQKCTQSIAGSYCGDWEGPSQSELEQMAKDERDSRLDDFEELALGSQGNFSDMKDKLQDIADEPYAPFDEGAVCNEVETPDQRIFTRDSTTGDSNGAPRYVNWSEVIFKSNDGNWRHIDIVGNILNETTNQPAELWLGEWTEGQVECVDFE